MISVLLAGFNESLNPYFWKTIDLVHSLSASGVAIELIVAVTPGDDETMERLAQMQVKVKICSTNQRAERYNLAFQDSSADDDDWIVLNHPRSNLSNEAFISLIKLDSSIQWGAFTHEFDLKHPLLNFTSWWSNYIRGDLKKIFYLDHCIFVKKNLLIKVGGLPRVEIFEDTLLSRNLSRHAKPTRLAWKSTTSAIRFIKNGPWKQAAQNQILKIKFSLGFSNRMMNSQYEKKINLNTKVDD